MMGQIKRLNEYWMLENKSITKKKHHIQNKWIEYKKFELRHGNRKY